MSKYIVERVRRQCCEERDLIPVTSKGLVNPNVPKYYQLPKVKRCKYCGQQYEYYRYTDAAGSMDYDYRPVTGENA